MTQFIEVGKGPLQRRIAVSVHEGNGPAVVWLCGFLSSMVSLKGEAMLQWAQRQHRQLIRFDYSGHGQSGGEFSMSSVSLWLEDALAVISHFAETRPILVGSSMGGWIATLATLALRRQNSDLTPRGLVLIAPAIDFTERLIWERLPSPAQQRLLKEGEISLPSQYSEQPYRITRNLIEDGRNHLLLGKPVELGCPIHILQGMLDPDVPWRHSAEFAEHLGHDDVITTLIRDGDHRLSRPEDLIRLQNAVSDMIAHTGLNGG